MTEEKFLQNIINAFKEKFPMVRLRYAFSPSEALHVFEVTDKQLWQNDVFNQLYIETCKAYEKAGFEGDICFMYPLDFELFGKWEIVYQPIPQTNTITQTNVINLSLDNIFTPNNLTTLAA